MELTLDGLNALASARWAVRAYSAGVLCMVLHVWVVPFPPDLIKAIVAYVGFSTVGMPHWLRSKVAPKNQPTVKCLTCDKTMHASKMECECGATFTS